MGKKVTKNDIFGSDGLKTELEDYYRLFRNQCEEEDKFYQRRFKVPKIKGHNIYRPPSATVAIDDAAAHIETTNILVEVPARSIADDKQQQAERLRQFYIGGWHRVNVEQGAVLHNVAKHLWLYGIGVLRVTLMQDLFRDAPKSTGDKKKFEEDFIQWQKDNNIPYPISVTVINPQNLLWDPSQTGSTFGIYIVKRKALEVSHRWGKWTNPKFKKGMEDVEWVEVWDDEYTTYFCDDEEVMSSKEHFYGFNPFVIINSGLGYISAEGRPEEMHRGLLWSCHDDLTLEARTVSQYESILRACAWPSKYFSGDPGGAMAASKQWDSTPGALNYLPEQVEINVEQPVIPPAELLALHGIAKSNIELGTESAIRRGERPPGVTTGYMTVVLASQAKQRAEPVTWALSRGVEAVNERMAMLVENVIPGPVTVWARTPAETFDRVIKDSDIDGYHVNHVSLSYIDPEDQERRGTYGAMLYQRGLISKDLWRRKYGMIENPSDEEIIQLAEILMEHPAVLARRAQDAAELIGFDLEALGQQAVSPVGNQGIPPPGAGFPFVPEQERTGSMRPTTMAGVGDVAGEIAGGQRGRPERGMAGR